MVKRRKCNQTKTGPIHYWQLYFIFTCYAINNCISFCLYINFLKWLECKKIIWYKCFKLHKHRLLSIYTKVSIQEINKQLKLVFTFLIGILLLFEWYFLTSFRINQISMKKVIIKMSVVINSIKYILKDFSLCLHNFNFEHCLTKYKHNNLNFYKEI